eukprot:TRINITY_DN1200_c0_g1_i1.p1 TRINITY_DN1200_c0_g1~~TRINITY_DN1200_c0_g1_i1.p1  ORF type:complete len:350 (+),score=146.58 TRINITY_DN1200_c0_g1_i1:81-1052(+)
MARPTCWWVPVLMAILVLVNSAHADEGGEDEDAGGEEGEYPEEGGEMPPDYGGGGDYGDYGDYGDHGDHGGGHGGGGGSSGPSLKKGVVHADSSTFPLVVDGSRAVLVKCDKDYPYGEKEDQFTAFAKREAVLESDLLVVEIGVNEYAPEDDADAKETKELCASMGATGEDSFPTYRLFKKGVNSVAQSIKYGGEVKADDLAAFVTKEAGVFLGPPGTLEAFDKFAVEFVRDVAAQDRILGEAKKARDALTRPRDVTYANFYISVMEKMKGAAEKAKCQACEQCFRHTEERRLRKLNQGSVSAEKRREFERRLNALPAFATAK